MRFIERRTEREVAELLGVARGTVQNDWAFARAWLHREIFGKDLKDEPTNDKEGDE